MEKIKRKYLELILGIILLIPPVFSVASYSLRFVGVNLPIMRAYDVDNEDKGTDKAKDQLSLPFWVGYGFTSALPIYFGLMAIAGAYLISNSTKK